MMHNVRINVHRFSRRNRTNAFLEQAIMQDKLYFGL